LNNDFNGWWNKVNNTISKGLILFFSALIISQFLLLNETVKTFISRIDKLEGRSIADSQLFIKKGEIEISIENNETLKSLVFYVNGDRINTPQSKSIKLQVKENDVIEVSGEEYSDTAILKITALSGNITVPELGKLIYVSNNLVMIDRVRLK